MDRRTARTRAALHEALIPLIIERGYDQVSVADVAERANVGRSTFYAHYTDKDALLRDGFGHMRAMLLKGLEADGGHVQRGGDPLAFSRLMTEHFADHVHLYGALMAGSAGAIVRDEIRSVVTDFIRAGVSSGVDKARREVTIQLVAGAFLSLVEWWLDRGAREPAAQIDMAFRAFASGGLAGSDAAR